LQGNWFGGVAPTEAVATAAGSESRKRASEREEVLYSMKTGK